MNVLNKDKGKKSKLISKMGENTNLCALKSLNDGQHQVTVCLLF